MEKVTQVKVTRYFGPPADYYGCFKVPVFMGKVNNLNITKTLKRKTLTKPQSKKSEIS